MSLHFLSYKTLFEIIKVPLRRFRHTGSVKQNCTGNKKPLIKFGCQVAVITGGSEGIGFAAAHELLEQKIRGVALIGIDFCKGRDAAHTLNCAYGKNKAIFLKCDVQSKIQISDCYLKVVKEFGRIDIVINSAGIFDGKNWETEVMTNLFGTINSTLEAYKVMSKDTVGKGGVIVNVAGIHGLAPLYPAPTLAASYHGIVGFSRSFGHDYNFKTTGVRLVTLCPGITNTNFLKNAEQKTLKENWTLQLTNMLQKLKRQNADVCGESILHLIQYGKSGSVWVVEGSKLYTLKIPDWTKYRKLAAQLL